VIQVNVENWPAEIVDGLAANEMIAGNVAVFTVITAVAVTVPPDPAAVSVYVVVAVGLTETDPLSGCVPVTPLIETVVTFVVVQLSVDDCPAVIRDGLATKETTAGGAAAAVTSMVAVAVAVPRGPTAVSV
jgi:hypothetical protein